jgi:hypothetical protein
LILKPSCLHPPQKAIVVIIDALDVALRGPNDEELLRILRDQVHFLPGSFRIFITSRPTEVLQSFLSDKSHILPCSIGIYSRDNQNDIIKYTKSQLAEVAERRNLGDNWPDKSMSVAFTKRAEGLFLWVFIICRYLCNSVNPTEQLKKIISKSSPQGLLAEKKMEELYITILNTCNWEDEDFVAGYSLVVGAVVAAKAPLSAQALQSLLGDTWTVPVDNILSPLGSLLAGVTDMGQPLRFLHQSLRDFITIGAGQSSNTTQFCLDIKDHTQRLSLLCLEMLNKELMSKCITGVGYLGENADSNAGIPEVSGVSEALLYACQFWTAHIIEVEVPGPGIIAAFQLIISDGLIPWMEIVASKGYFGGIQRVCDWLKVSIYLYSCLHQSHFSLLACFSCQV